MKYTPSQSEAAAQAAAASFASVPYCIAELSLHYTLREAPAARVQIACSDDFERFIRPYFGDEIETRELFFAVFLNQAHHIIGVYQLSAGGITGTVADIRLILAMGLQILCNQIIITHNHPSGNLAASSADQLLTDKLKTAASTHDMRLLDHIIMTRHGYYSFGDNGLMG